MLVHEKPESVLVTGLATRIILFDLEEYSDVTHIYCVEIIAAQYDTALLFGDENNQIAQDKCLNVIIRLKTLENPSHN